MYTEIEEARAEIKRRFKNEKLKQRVKNCLGELPSFFEDMTAPRAVIARQIATPNHESFRFWEMTSGNGLRPTWLEYSEDFFCSSNSDKRFLGKLVFYHGKGRNGGDKTKIFKVINLDQPSNKRICDIQLKQNPSQKLLNVHHEMFEMAFPETGPEIFDVSPWIKKMGGRAEKYYTALFSLFVCHAVLFESFLTSGSEGNFLRRIVAPSFNKVTEQFGVKPLVVRLLPKEKEQENYWCWYPGGLQKCVER